MLAPFMGHLLGISRLVNLLKLQVPWLHFWLQNHWKGCLGFSNRLHQMSLEYTARFENYC